MFRNQIWKINLAQAIGLMQNNDGFKKNGDDIHKLKFNGAVALDLLKWVSGEIDWGWIYRQNPDVDSLALGAG